VLRPELTAPLARHVVTEMLLHGRPEHLPLRLAYAGNAFRDVEPRAQRPREFRQVGVELVGASGPLADLEVILCACDAAEALALPGWTLQLGNARLYASLLADLGVPARAVGVVASGLDQLARVRARAFAGGEQFRPFALGFARELAGRMAVAGVPVDPPALASPEGLSTASLLVDLPLALEGFLRAGWVKNHAVPVEAAERALSLVPGDDSAAMVLAALRAHARSDVTLASLAALESLVDEVVAARGLAVRVSPATSRGLAYYTGVCFEIHVPGQRASGTDVCGGGRYDTLHQWVHDRARLTREARGERPGPALADDVLCGMGFAFGVEQVVAALEEAGPGPAAPRDVFVGATEDAHLDEAFRIADRLRRDGVAARSEVLGLRAGQGVAEQLGQASASGARWAILVGSEEWAEGRVVVRDLDAHTQITVPLDEALRRVRGAP